jgi:hypothetical protein
MEGCLCRVRGEDYFSGDVMFYNGGVFVSREKMIIIITGMDDFMFYTKVGECLCRVRNFN